MTTIRRLAILGTVLLGCIAPAIGASLSFQGNFVHDNDVQLFAFTLSADDTITLQTFGYGGGVNANGQVISAGGFESALQVFNAANGQAVGGPILPGPDPGCAPRNPDPARFNFCQDAYAQLFLTTGEYLLALTQYQNLPIGNLSDGFFYVDAVPDPNFNNGFVGSFNLPGTSAWALDIVAVDSAQSAPEPSTIMLAPAVLLFAAIAARKRVS